MWQSYLGRILTNSLCACGGKKKRQKKKKKKKSVLGLSSLILRTGQADNSLGTMQGCPDFQISFTLMLEFWDKTIKYFET